MISYDPLFKTIKDKGITQTDLLDKAGFDNHTFFDIRKGESVSLKTVEKLCRILGCGIEDIVSIIPEDDWEPYVRNIPPRKNKDSES